jgi:predicted nucleic acid-binding Zn ribbon protein
MSRDFTPHYNRLMPLADLIKHSPKLKRLGIMDGNTELALRQQWNAVVGPAVAANTRPLAFKRGVLNVAVRSNAWMQQLTFLKPQLLENLKQTLGEASVQDLRFCLADKGFEEGEA